MNQWRKDGEAIRSLSFDELEERMVRFINKYSHYCTIPGLEVEDLAQEVRLTLWKCQQRFTPTPTGFEGHPADFMTYATTAVINRLINLQTATNKFYRPVKLMECMECSARLPAQTGAKCETCGGRKWKNLHGIDKETGERFDPLIMSAEMIVTGDVEDESDDFDFVVSKDSVDRLLADLPPEMAEAARHILKDEGIDIKEKKALRRQGRKMNRGVYA